MTTKPKYSAILSSSRPTLATEPTAPTISPPVRSHANLHLDPKIRSGERWWAEDVGEVLKDADWRDLRFVLSHHDQCATVTGIKADTPSGKPA